MLIEVCPLSRSFSDEGLTYSISDDLELNVGAIVEVPYGKKIIDAVVLKIDTKNDHLDIKNIKEVKEIKYSEGLLAPHQITLLLFIAHHYFCLLHVSLSLFFPRNLKEKITKKTLKFPNEVLSYEYKNSQKLTDLQRKKLEEIQNSSNLNVLFYGITGSGKTSIYIELIKEQLDKGNQTLLLVPEIILTSQISSKIAQVFGKEVVVLNSSVSEAKKTSKWLDIYSGSAKVIVGTRSSLFYPYKNLGRIIIDEEHDRSYKSDTAPRYDAREIAFKLSDLLDIPVLLGSGTPSINMMYKAVKKDIGLVTLLEEYR